MFESFKFKEEGRTVEGATGDTSTRQSGERGASEEERREQMKVGVLKFLEDEKENGVDWGTNDFVGSSTFIDKLVEAGIISKRDLGFSNFEMGILNPLLKEISRELIESKKQEDSGVEDYQEQKAA